MRPCAVAYRLTQAAAAHFPQLVSARADGRRAGPRGRDAVAGVPFS